MLLMVSIGALILLLALFILFHENANATKGYRLRGLERQRSLLLLQGEVQNMLIAESQALDHLQSDPQVRAMPPARSVRYTEGEAAVAANR